ncbi:MAG: hypothetical protein ABL955_07120 [Elusimicrobiota bacterium]
MKLLPLALALTLVGPASAASTDSDFAVSLGSIGEALIGKARGLKNEFRPMTQESGPNDPTASIEGLRPVTDVNLQEAPVVLTLPGSSCPARTPANPAAESAPDFSPTR